jgi:hypothetical protein
MKRPFAARLREVLLIAFLGAVIVAGITKLLCVVLQQIFQ